MALATWWVGDPLPELKPLADFQVRRVEFDDYGNRLIAQLNNISVEEVKVRRQAGNHPYLGYIGEMAVTYGWVATCEASIGELNLVFSLPTEERYLWDFATIPEWQGKGLYPRLLHEIIKLENANRFWIINAPENLPSGAGMQKAGFQAVGQLSFRQDGSVGLIPIKTAFHERAYSGATRLAVPLIEEGLSPCWGYMEKLVCSCKLDPEKCSCKLEVWNHSTTGAHQEKSVLEVSG